MGKWYLQLLYFSFCFTYIQVYLSTIQKHIYTYSEPSVSLAYPEHWDIQNSNSI